MNIKKKNVLSTKWIQIDDKSHERYILVKVEQKKLASILCFKIYELILL